MKTKVLAAAISSAVFSAAVGLASPAAAISYFSIGAVDFHVGGFDPGLGPHMRDVVTFDSGPAAGVTETDHGDVSVYTHNSYRSSAEIAAAPAGDTSAYEAIGAGGSVTFDFSRYLAHHHVNTVSFYWGSIDSYNVVQILNRQGEVIGTINGTELPAANGDQGAAITNRRVYISLSPSDHFGGLRFLSNGVAFEYDDIAVGPAVFHAPNGAVFLNTPLPFAADFASAPEPTAWLLMLVGSGLVGSMLRRRERDAGPLEAPRA